MNPNSTHHSNLITVPGASMTNDDFDTMDIEFEAHEQAEKPMIEEARLLWFNGLPTDTDVNAIGWHIKAGVNPYLDETMEGMGVQKYLVQHKRPDKDGNADPKPYWRLRQCNLVIVAQRLQSTLEMSRTLKERYGIAYAWETIKDEQGQPAMNRHGKRTVLKLRAFVHELYQHGYYDWLPLTLSGFSTDSMLEALAEQYRVLECYSAIRRAQGKNPIAPFYLFSIPLGPGTMKLVGEPPTQGAIYPITANIPAPVEREYLQEHLIPRDLIERLREGLLTETIVWSIDESEKIASGRSGQSEALALSEEPPPEPASAPSLQSPMSPGFPREDDPLIQQPQLTWIARTFCGGSPEKMQQVCSDFHVSSPDQLRMSHFRQLVSQVQSAQKRPGSR